MQKSFFLNILLCLFCTTSYAQLQLTIGDVNANPGETISIPVMLSADEPVDVVVYQFNLEWNTTQLTYLSTENYFINSLVASDFGTIHTVENTQQLITGWESYPDVFSVTTEPITLFTLNFEVANPLLDDDAIKINFCVDCITEFYDDHIQALEVRATNGNVYMNTILPLELLTFTAKNVNDEVVLNWLSKNETAFSHFEIEHGIDAKNWKTIGQVEANGMTNTHVNYQFTDTQPIIGENLYRLKLMDDNGKFEYSSIAAVQITKPTHSLSFENPVRSVLNLQYTAIQKETLPLKLYDVKGQLVKQTIWKVEKGIQDKKWNLSNLAGGVYFLRLGIDNGLVYKVLKK